MEMVLKPCLDRFLYPILVKISNEKKEKKGSQMGHTKKILCLSTIFSNDIKTIEQKKNYL